jgi:hypothetical protein
MNLKVRNIVNALTLKVYRTFAVFTLYGVLFAVAGYAFVMGFYVINTNWGVPVIISPSDEKGLEMAEQVTTSVSTLQALLLDRDKSLAAAHAADSYIESLRGTHGQMGDAIKRESIQNTDLNFELGGLINKKSRDNSQASQVVSALTPVQEQAKRDLRSGLITKYDETMLEGQINQMRLSSTDSQVSEVILKDLLSQRRTDGTAFLEVLSKKAAIDDLVNQQHLIAQAGAIQAAADAKSIHLLEQAVEFAKNNPYYHAVDARKPITLAFIPYDNRQGAETGAIVYACYLQTIFCHAVGHVTTIYTTEEHVQHPTFHTDIRGFFVELTLTESSASRSKTIFIGRKPLWF